METWQLCSQTAAVLLVKTLFIIVVLETAVEPQKEERRQNKPESFQRKNSDSNLDPHTAPLKRRDQRKLLHLSRFLL